MRQHEAEHNVHVRGVRTPSAFADPPRLGNICVVGYYEHVDAVNAAHIEARREAARDLQAWVQAHYPIIKGTVDIPIWDALDVVEGKPVGPAKGEG
jgi:4'-phosphopantetheinyl transferase EntD